MAFLDRSDSFHSLSAFTILQFDRIGPHAGTSHYFVLVNRPPHGADRRSINRPNPAASTKDIRVTIR